MKKMNMSSLPANAYNRLSNKWFCILFVLFQCSLFQSKAQIINTIAGTGVSGFSGDGGPATSAQLWNPAALMSDSVGNIFFSQLLNFRISEINTSGIINTVVGTGTAGYAGDGGPATAAQINVPHGLAMDKHGNIYFSQNSNHVIRKVNCSGTVTNYAGNGVMGFSGDGGPASAAMLNRPRSLVTDRNGNIYFTDYGNNRVRKIDTSGIITTVAGAGPAGFGGDGGLAVDALLNAPGGVAVDTFGNLYIADYFNNRLRKVDPSGIISTIAGNGSMGMTGDGGPATAAQVECIEVTADNSGNLFVVEYHKVRKINLHTGIITSIAGNGVPGFSGDGGPASAAPLYTPHSTAFDIQGNMYITEVANQRVRKITLPSINITSSAAGPICSGTEVVFTASVANNAATPSYQWQINGHSAGTDTSAYVSSSLHNHDTVTCMFSYIFGDTAYSVSNKIIMSVDSPVNAGNIEGLDTVCVGHSISLIDAITGGAWTATNTHASVSGGVVSGLSVGIDTIHYSVSNACGSAMATHIVIVRTCPTSVSSQQASPDAMVIYPNPADGDFTVQLTSQFAGPIQFSIADVDGRLIEERTSAAGTSVPFSLHVPPGVYLIRAVTVQGTVTQKLVIRP